MDSEIKIVKRVDRILDTNSDLKSSCKEILAELMRSLKSKNGAILSLDKENERRTTLAKKGQLNYRLINECVNSGKTTRTKNGSLAVPIRIDKRLFGVVYIGQSKNYTEADKFISNIEAILDGKFMHDSDSHGLKKIFSRYVGDSVMEKVLDKKDKDVLSGETKLVSVLFVDVNGFTAYSNTHKPEKVISFLNEFFEEMSNIILKNKGTIDKFIGDEIMAVFGAPIKIRKHAKTSIETAKELRVKAKTILEKHHIKDSGVSVGIASGRVISGNIGSSKMTDYTVIGKKVNLAARLTSLAGKNEIYVDDTTKEAAPEFKYKSLGKKPIKGFSDMTVFKVLG